MRILSGRAGEADEGRPLKYYLRSDMGLSSHQLSLAKYEGSIRVNGAVVRVNECLRAGDLVEVTLTEDAQRSVQPEAGEIHIVYRDEDVLVLDKPAPLACQCSPKQPTGTLENRLAAAFPGEGFLFRPINRLDKGTSGLMAAGMNAWATRRMQRQLHTPAFIRQYLAVVEGALTGEGIIDLPIAKCAEATVRRCVDPVHGKAARTHYRAIETCAERTLVRLQLDTGRTHQIRVHMSAIGHPLVGDFLYGREIGSLPGRFALHACFLAFDHPATGERIALTSELPKELKELLS